MVLYLTLEKNNGVPTPVTDQVVSIVKDIENGKHKYQFSNLNLIKVPKVN